MLQIVEYYDRCAKEYAELTVNADMSETRAKFLRYLPVGAAILDAGCGSGRDSLAFMQSGYDVTMLDASAGMCKCAEALTGQKALCMSFDEMDFANRFDGIWACASLLHVPEKNLETVFVKFWHALKDNGILYASWKYGEAERQDGERFYCDMTEEKLKNVLARVKAKYCLPDANMCSETHDGESDANLFEWLDCWVAEGALPSGREQKWLNVIVRKALQAERNE